MKNPIDYIIEQAAAVLADGPIREGRLTMLLQRDNWATCPHAIRSAFARMEAEGQIVPSSDDRGHLVFSLAPKSS